MSEFGITWRPLAEDQLADSWLMAPDRSAVSKAQTAIDRLHAIDPHSYGRHLSEGLFLLHFAPLSVFYTIDDEVKHVWVEELRIDP